MFPTIRKTHSIWYFDNPESYEWYLFSHLITQFIIPYSIGFRQSTATQSNNIMDRIMIKVNKLLCNIYLNHPAKKRNCIQPSISYRNTLPFSQHPSSNAKRRLWSRHLPYGRFFFQKPQLRKNERIIQEYIRNQLEEDYAKDQISIKEYMDPFTGSKNK